MSFSHVINVCVSLIREPEFKCEAEADNDLVFAIFNPLLGLKGQTFCSLVTMKNYKARAKTLLQKEKTEFYLGLLKYLSLFQDEYEIMINPKTISTVNQNADYR